MGCGMRMRFLILAAAVAFAVAASGQSSDGWLISPQSPSSVAPVYVTVTHCGCAGPPPHAFVRNGNVIDLQVVRENVCVAACTVDSASFELGVLPPGTYTLRFVWITDYAPPRVERTSTLVVRDATIPALSHPALLALALAFGILGTAVLRWR